MWLNSKKVKQKNRTISKSVTSPLAGEMSAPNLENQKKSVGEAVKAGEILRPQSPEKVRQDSSSGTRRDTMSSTKKQRDCSVLEDFENERTLGEETREASQVSDDVIKGLTEEEIDVIRNSGSIEGDEEFLWEIIATTRKSGREKISAIDAAIIRRDWTAASKHCHTLKGSTSMLDMKALWSASLNCEKAFKELIATSHVGGITPQCRAAVEKLRYEIERLENTRNGD